MKGRFGCFLISKPSSLCLPRISEGYSEIMDQGLLLLPLSSLHKPLMDEVGKQIYHPASDSESLNKDM